MKAVTLVTGLALGLATATASPFEKRQLQPMSCTARPHNGPLITNPDTVERFKEYAYSVANATLGSVPNGFRLVDGFVGLEATAQHPSYMMSLGPEGYRPEQCAEACRLIDGCRVFNIFFERVPLIVDPITLAPNPMVCPGKADSPSASLIRCSFYNDAIRPEHATNAGQFFGEFPSVIAGSIAFERTTAETSRLGPGSGSVLQGFSDPVDFGNQTIQSSGLDYLRLEQFGGASPTPEFNPFLCALSCASQVRPDGLPLCVFFNAYIEHTNSERGVFICAYYGQDHNADEATNRGQIDGEGNVHSITSSFGYSLRNEFRNATSRA